ncbi:IclR family transcriptional regulator [Pseudorhodoferax soli]|nr:IclR family transcriptional regulator [Pseudorhodoferax soli]
MDRTLLKGLAVLEALADLGSDARTIADVAQHTGLSHSNAHRTLQTLIHAGYVEREETRGYRGTMKMFALGVRQLGRRDIRRLAQPHMARLAEETGHAVHLSVLDGAEVIYIDKVEGAQPISAYSHVGGRAPAHAVATGKALLAGGGAAAASALPSRLTQFTASTIVVRDELQVELENASRSGYAVNRGEWREDVGGIASPIFTGLARPIAALGISGPTARLSPVQVRRFAPRIMAMARELSIALGYSPGDPLRACSTGYRPCA